METYYCKRCDLKNVQRTCESCGEEAKTEGEMIDDAMDALEEK